ncbi:MAG: DoxX family membrane protein [Candidatus Omnitrophota bacterium]
MRNKMGILLLRISLGALFIVFGIGIFQCDSTALAIRNILTYCYLPWSLDLTVKIIGILEIIIGFFLITGAFVKIVALFGVVLLITVFILSGFRELRDIVLISAGIAIFISNADPFNLVKVIKKTFSKKRR